MGERWVNNGQHTLCTRGKHEDDWCKVIVYKVGNVVLLVVKILRDFTLYLALSFVIYVSVPVS